MRSMSDTSQAVTECWNVTRNLSASTRFKRLKCPGGVGNSITEDDDRDGHELWRGMAWEVVVDVE